ncbi:hypothetical protein RHS01_00127 [Rhizoctonia solani]|uniref:Uncharacterized protein n=1 Tax=Rhizoctonia solani TaxID=456999 RepID=A0A8H7M9E7_9AGAM|nr:hypothetical protein RHS01_00127 [Rhizoctonia solani]
MGFTLLVLAIAVGSARCATSRQSPTECADGSMTLWMQNSDGKNPCELVQDVLRVCDPSFSLEFLPRGYTCDNSYGSTLAPCCCGSPTFALMSACWSCQYNITFELVSTTFTGFVKDCQTLPNPITSYDTRVRSNITALGLPLWSQVEPLAGKWDFTGAWRNSTPSPTVAPPVPTGYPIQFNSTGISKGALAGSRAHVDLDEDTASPRSSRWLGVPSYLQPTSFHSPSSADSGSPIPGQQELSPHNTPSGQNMPREAQAIAPLCTSHVANNGGTTSDEENRAPAPQPALLPRPPSTSSGPDSTSTSDLHGHSASTGSGSGTRYQEDDAGYRIVIEDGSGGQEVVRSVPPAYVDYRKGYSNARLDKRSLTRQDSAQADGSNNTHEGSSGSAVSETGRPARTSDNTSTTCINSSSNHSGPSSPKEANAEAHDTDTIDAKTMTETNTVREPLTEPDHRDRTESGDSEGAATIKPPRNLETRAIERSSTSDLAALTAANTAANRPTTSGSKRFLSYGSPIACYSHFGPRRKQDDPKTSGDISPPRTIPRRPLQAQPLGAGAAH